jgi:hypothetical protein
MIKRDVFGAINFITYIPIYAGLVYLGHTQTSESGMWTWLGMGIWTILNSALGVLFLAACISIIGFTNKIEKKSYEIGERPRPKKSIEPITNDKLNERAESKP